VDRSLSDPPPERSHASPIALRIVFLLAGYDGQARFRFLELRGVAKIAAAANFKTTRKGTTVMTCQGFPDVTFP
jgi:hypothetical protein